MNENNHFQNENNQTPTDSWWAKIVDQRHQLATDSNGKVSDGTQSAEQVDLNSQLLDDLELDGQLRMLGKMSSPDDLFAQQIIAQAYPESNLADANSSRLTVVEPIFATGTSATATETNLTPTTDETADELADSNLAVTPFPGSRRRKVVPLAAFAATLFICCSAGAMWWFGTQPGIADSDTPNPGIADLGVANPGVANPGVANTEGIETAPAQPNSLEDDPLEVFHLSDEDSNDFSTDNADEGLVEHSNEEDSEIDPLAALIAEIDHSNLDTNPTVADTKLDFGPIDTEKNLEDQADVVANPNGLPWDSKLDWNLAIRFGSNGLGSVSLNGKSVQAIFLQDNAVFLLRQIAGELERRVEYLENRLGSAINGSIAIGKTNFRFDHFSELDEAIDKVEQRIADLNIRTLGVDELMSLRVKYREGIYANRDRFGSIDLANKNLKFYTEDEAFAICAVVSASEVLLHELAEKRLDWEKDIETLPTKSHLVNRITPKAFQIFEKSGTLPLPDPEFSDQSLASIQKLGTSELMHALQSAPSVELFRNFDEFQQAKDYVFSNGPPEMKLRLSIDKIDRLLEEEEKSSKKSISGSMKDMLSQEKGRLSANLRSSGVSIPKDSTAMQPLKDVLAKRTDLQGLPLVMGAECQSDATETSDLSQVAFSLGRMIGQFNGSLGSRDTAQHDAFRNLSIKQMVSYCMEEHLKDREGNSESDPSPQKMKTVDQILQIDHPRLRLEFIDALRKSDSKAAIKLIVNKAKFDLVPEIRVAATEALADTEPEEYRELLLEGLKYPWHVVAEHSAEALVRLNDQGAIPKLVEMLELPHPHLPFAVDGELVQRELVGINHMRNCLLCHAPSISALDSTRGLVPHSSRPVPEHYYSGSAEDPTPYAVRADITYLEQDFSVVQPVKDPGPWPAEQRFDYVVQRKKLTPEEASNVAARIFQGPNRNRNAIVFALRELTGETPEDNSYSSWKKILSER